MPILLLLLLAALAPAGDPVEFPTSLAAVEPSADALPEWLEPQAGRASATTPSRRVELNVFAGAVVFESDFESDPFLSLGAMLRVPLPFLPTGRFALFGELLVSKMDRDLDPNPDSDGVFFGAGFGADFALYRSPAWYLLAQAGTIFFSFGDIDGVDDGLGALLGLQAGFAIDRRDPRWSFTVNPQMALDGSEWLFFLNAGVNYRF